MSTSVLKNALLLFDDRNLGLMANTVGLDYGVEPRDDTRLSMDTRSNVGGLKTAGVAAEGFVDVSTNEDTNVLSSVGAEGKIVSIADGVSVGSRAYSLECVAGQFTPIEGQVGDVAAFSLEAMSRDDLKRGSLLFHSLSEQSSADGSSLNAGSVASRLTAVLHVFSASAGDTLDVSIESDADDTFATPVTRASFSQATSRTAELVAVDGVISDTWWRVSYSIAGSSPDFGFAVILILE